MTKDSHKLHALVDNLTTKNIDEGWPEHTSDEQLAEDFASYFHGKIDKIRNIFRDKPKYTTSKSDALELIKFTPLTERQVSKIINFT